VSRKLLIMTLWVTFFFMVIFALWPQLDLAAERPYFVAGHFIGHTPIGVFFRYLFYYAPYVVFALFLGAFARRPFQLSPRGPNGRAVLFLTLSLALGPGLLVNGLLKEHSHRPRPVQTQEFGGRWKFRPYDRMDGQCGHNCSFVSGEVSAAAWTLAPALLAPPVVRPLAIGGALLFTAMVGKLRMAFGGHYLSDVVFAALFTFLIVLGLHRWYSRHPEGG